MKLSLTKSELEDIVYTCVAKTFKETENYLVFDAHTYKLILKSVIEELPDKIKELLSESDKDAL